MSRSFALGGSSGDGHKYACPRRRSSTSSCSLAPSSKASTSNHFCRPHLNFGIASLAPKPDNKHTSTAPPLSKPLGRHSLGEQSNCLPLLLHQLNLPLLPQVTHPDRFPDRTFGDPNTHPQPTVQDDGGPTRGGLRLHRGTTRRPLVRPHLLHPRRQHGTPSSLLRQRRRRDRRQMH